MPRHGDGGDPDGIDRRSGDEQGPHASWYQATGAERAIAVAVLALTVAWAPGLGIGAWPPEMGLAVAVGFAGVPVLVARALRRRGSTPRAEQVASILLLGWVVVGLVSALHSARPLLSLGGLYEQSTGWLFMVAVAGFWGLGTLLRQPGRALLASAVVAGAVANAVVAVLQLAIGLSRSGLPRYPSGQPLGLQGNPVFLGALEAAAVTVLVVRIGEGQASARHWVALALAAVGVGAAGERLSILIALVLALWVAVSPWWRRTGGTVAWWRATGRWRLAERASAGTSWRLAALTGLLTVAAVGVGTLLPLVRSTNELANKLATSAEGTFGDRLHAWLEGLRAVVHQPLLGAGPGRFEAATAGLFPLWFVRSHPGTVFSDGHDLFVEYMVTTGILGLVLLAGWALVAVRGRTGVLLAMAAVVGVVELVEPLNPVLTPVLFVALGAAPWRCPEPPWAPRPAVERGPAGIRRASRRWALPVGAVVTTLVGVLLAADFVGGSRALAAAQSALQHGHRRAAAVDARLADELLRPWPQSAQQLALVDLLSPQRHGGPTPLAAAAHWYQVAAERDPADAPAWDAAAQSQAELGHLGLARRDAQTALRSYPWEPGALSLLGELSLQAHQLTEARQYFRRLSEVRPGLSVGQLMRASCRARQSGQAVALVIGGFCT